MDLHAGRVLHCPVARAAGLQPGAAEARTAGIVIALEPVYAIAFAAILFAQYPSARALAGGALIIGAIVWSGLRRANPESDATIAPASATTSKAPSPD